MPNTIPLTQLTDWRDRLSREIYELCSDDSRVVDGYRCETQERAEEVRGNSVDYALAVLDFLNARICRARDAHAVLAPGERFIGRVMAKVRR